MAKAIKYDPSTTSASESAMLRELDTLLHSLEDVAVTSGQGKSVPLTESFKQLLHIFTHAAAQNESLVIYTSPQDLSAQEAADMLNVSRPYLIEHLLEKGEIPYHYTGTHRRIALTDVLTYLQRRDSQRRERLRRLSQMSEEVGLGDE